MNGVTSSDSQPLAAVRRIRRGVTVSSAGPRRSSAHGIDSADRNPVAGHSCESALSRRSTLREPQPVERTSTIFARIRFWRGTGSPDEATSSDRRPYFRTVRPSVSLSGRNGAAWRCFTTTPIRLSFHTTPLAVPLSSARAPRRMFTCCDCLRGTHIRTSARRFLSSAAARSMSLYTTPDR